MPLKFLLRGIVVLKIINRSVAFNGVLRIRSSSPQRSHYSFQYQVSKGTAKEQQITETLKLLLHSSRSDISNHRNQINENSDHNTTATATTVASQAALIAGTTIGGGFLALPTATAPCGAAPAALGLIVVWLFLLGGAFSLTNAIFMMKRNGREGENAIQVQAKDISLFSLIRECFGDIAGILGGLLFLLLVKVTLIAQLSKVGVLLETSLPISDRRGWTTLFSISITTLCCIGKQRKIERINDALTAAMLLSFASLVGLAGFSGWSAHGLKRGEFKSLLPPFSSSTSSSPWAIPIFIQLLIYNEVVPLASSRLGDERKVQRAILFGSSVPLIMCLVWSCVALGLVPYEPSMMVKGMIYDPLTNLSDIVLSKCGSVGKLFLASVNMLAGSAICTTVIGSILACAQYFDDIIGNLIGCGRGIGGHGGNTTNDNSDLLQEANILNDTQRTISLKYRKLITHALAVAPSAVVVLRGSSNLYYHATSFAGEFPCTLLYGLIPPLCNLRMRWKLGNNQSEATEPTTGKDAALQIGLAIVSLVILAVCAISR